MAKSSSKIILVGLAGLAAGLAIGLLLAPSKGSKTRKRLRKRFRKTKEFFQQTELSDTINDLRSIFTREKEDQTEPDATSTNSDQPKT